MLPCTPVADNQITSIHPGSSFWGGMGPPKGLLLIVLTAQHSETAPWSMQVHPGCLCKNKKTHSQQTRSRNWSSSLVGEILPSFRYSVTLPWVAQRFFVGMTSRTWDAIICIWQVTIIMSITLTNKKTDQFRGFCHLGGSCKTVCTCWAT